MDPAKQPRDRNFDFTKDYVVLGRLGNTLFKRSTLATGDGRVQREFLLRAVAAYERALAVDPEDVVSHFGLGQCYARLGQDAPEDAAEPVPVTAERLLALGAEVSNGKEAGAKRIGSAAQLGRASTTLGRQAPDPKAPRLPPLRDLLGILEPAFREEKDQAVQDAIAAALGHLHRELHTIYKTDEQARARATELYRRKHAAANAAAEAIVIYPTQRPARRALIAER